MTKTTSMASDLGPTPVKKPSFSIAIPHISDTASVTSNGSMKTPINGLRSPLLGDLGADGILGGSLGRSRTMSVSSLDQPDLAVDGIDIPTSDPRPNPKKRPSTDALEYPRRRATIAVSMDSDPRSAVLT